MATYCSGNDCYAQVNTNVQFTDTSTGGTISAWTWNFGDGATSTIKNPTHTYTTIGNYTLVHSVTDNCGTGTCANKIMHVTETIPSEPTSFGIPLEWIALALSLGIVGIVVLQQQPQIPKSTRK